MWVESTLSFTSVHPTPPLWTLFCRSPLCFVGLHRFRESLCAGQRSHVKPANRKLGGSLLADQGHFCAFFLKFSQTREMLKKIKIFVWLNFSCANLLFSWRKKMLLFCFKEEFATICFVSSFYEIFHINILNFTAKLAALNVFKKNKVNWSFCIKRYFHFVYGSTFLKRSLDTVLRLPTAPHTFLKRYQGWAQRTYFQTEMTLTFKYCIYSFRSKIS